MHPYRPQVTLAMFLMGKALQEDGYLPSLHHAEKIKGENRQIVDKEKGVYRFDDLAVLKAAKCPAVLLECGIIKNRREELLLQSTHHQLKIVAAIMKALAEFTDKFDESRKGSGLRLQTIRTPSQ